jgi:hypothetical protein
VHSQAGPGLPDEATAGKSGDHPFRSPAITPFKETFVLKFLVVSAIAVLATAGATTPLAAQARSAVSSAELEAAVVKAPAANQEAVQAFLRDSRVTEVAAKLGLRTAELSAAVSALDEATLKQVADRTRAADRDLAGGDQIIISTTVIIIILLILILLTN